MVRKDGGQIHRLLTKRLYIQRKEFFILNEIVDLETSRRVLASRGFAGNTSNNERSHELLESFGESACCERGESGEILRRENKRESILYIYEEHCPSKISHK